MSLKSSFAALGLLILTGCGGATDLVAVNEPTAKGSYRVSLSTLELREPSLPSYALADEISVEAEDGTLVSIPDVLWADKPERAIALELTRHLSGLTRARIAASPWPFEALPEGTLDLRFETLLARANGSFQVTGQYFVGRLDAGPERSGFFDLSVPIAEPVSPVTVSQARGRAIALLAEDLAKNALR
ncbi:membrane integrity-associated transporter subunit PqiC [Alphaproteobacteria bacterium KMM 3653]|uniref:Membrane integrity-associated transporter subunit PqiC n=1 Tax=Harenicola maris TaxID=2841044 RepID=A0AAP2CVS1_9RHOB|nr:membrane integrity-associated transporter subunit PqiC [Harenicola maris]